MQGYSDRRVMISLGSQAFPVARRSAFLKSGKAWDETSREG